ncbi:hypothetical protein B2J93_8807 [Marssonina coronariae]|uniref:Uncharacterized protein n=1 Tax=Diplocarpon coronariae TaxID=2795749 RepID=A0A218YVW1_9HELO|nr:hypothetical protein B2J93_8807 [Marssonina coronariae]
MGWLESWVRVVLTGSLAAPGSYTVTPAGRSPAGWNLDRGQPRSSDDMVSERRRTQARARARARARAQAQAQAHAHTQAHAHAMIPPDDCFSHDVEHEAPTASSGPDDELHMSGDALPQHPASSIQNPESRSRGGRGGQPSPALVGEQTIEAAPT